MALHDYQCPGCGHLARDIHVPIQIGAQKGAPVCPACHGCRLAWIPQVGAMDAKEPFSQFDTTDNLGRPLHIDSLSAIRKAERDSERMAADGIGSPMVWRDYSQNASNKDRHALTQQTPDQMADPRGVQPAIQSALRKGKLTPARGDAVTSVHGRIDGD